MRRHDLEQRIARGLDGETLISASDRMTHAIRFVGVEEDTMANVGNNACLRTVVLDENTAKRQHQRGRSCIFLGSAASVVGPTIDNANASDRAVMRAAGRQ